MIAGFDWAIRDGIVWIRLNRPPQNSLDSAFFAGMARLVDELAVAPLTPTDRIRGLIIHGQGKHFSSGADLDELGGLLKGQAAEPDFLRENSRALDRLSGLPFPTIAAIAGCCLGAGLELALACRYRLAAGNAMLAFPESGFGIIPGCGGTVRAGERLGPGRAIEMVLSGGYVVAEEALRLGLVDGILPREELLNGAARLIGKIWV